MGPAVVMCPCCCLPAGLQGKVWAGSGGSDKRHWLSYRGSHPRASAGSCSPSLIDNDAANYLSSNSQQSLHRLIKLRGGGSPAWPNRECQVDRQKGQQDEGQLSMAA